jgi:hypothetical protein
LQEGVTSTPLAGSSFLAVTPSGCFFASAKALDLRTIVFFTAVPNPQQNRFWHGFWSNKLRYLGSRGIYVCKGRISPAWQEKGVNIAIDLVRFTFLSHPAFPPPSSDRLSSTLILCPVFGEYYIYMLDFKKDNCRPKCGGKMPILFSNF